MKYKYFKALGLGAILAASIVFLVFNWSGLLVPPWKTGFEFSYPEYAAGDGEDRFYIIDNSKRRLTRVDADNTASLVIEGGLRSSDGFFYALDVAADREGNIFLLNNVLDENGYNLVREEILVYDSTGSLTGRYDVREYGTEERKPTLVQRGRIQGLDYLGNNLHWFSVDEEGIQALELNSDTGELENGTYYPLENASLKIGNVRRNPLGGFVFSLKNGQIYSVREDGESSLLYQAPQNSFEIIPWEVGVDLQGQVYFVDLENRAFRRIESVEEAPIVLDHSLLASHVEELYEFDYYRLSLREDGPLLTTNEEAALKWYPSTGEIRYISGAQYLQSQILFRWLLWLTPIIGALALFLLVRVIFIDFLQGKPSQILLQSLMIMSVVAISAVVVVNLVVPNLTERYQTVILEKISQMLQVYPKVVDGDRFDQIQGIGDFNNEDYRYIRQTFLESLNYNQDDWNESYYFALYQVVEGRLYAFMYLNGLVGMRHPFDWLGWDGVYDHALEGDIATVMEQDITGEWIYGVSPIYNSQGEVVALFETGTDLYAFQLANDELIRKIFLEILTTLVILVLLMIELSFLYNSLSKRQRLTELGSSEVFPARRAEDKDKVYSDVQLARPLSFLLFTGISMSMAFIPLMMNGLYEPIPGFSRDFLLALPISVEMFFFGMATILGGVILKRLGWRTVFVLGLGLTGAGLLYSGFSQDMMNFLQARLLTGFGSGLGYIALRSFINKEGREAQRSQGFSHFYAGMIAGVNAGVVFGAGLADTIGFNNVFFIAFTIIVLTLLFFILFLRDTPHLEASSNNPILSFNKALKQFVSSSKVWVLFLFLVLPTYLAGTFLQYYFPLFAEAQGLATADIGRLFILNGLFIIYLGPPLSRVFKRKLGDYKTTLIGSVFWGLSLIVFALTGSLWGAIAALILMGVTEGFCVTAQNDLYLSLDVSQKVGEDQAVSYFELFGKMGETLGPIGFSLALILGQSMGILSMGAMIILAIIPALFFLKTKRSTHA